MRSEQRNVNGILVNKVARLIADHISAFATSSVLLLPLIRVGLGESDLGWMVWAIYGSVLLPILLLIHRVRLKAFNRIDVVLLLFVLIYVASQFYTVALDFDKKLLLIYMFPLYYYAGKVVYLAGVFRLVMAYLVLGTLLYSGYLLYWLSILDFDFTAFYWKSDAVFRATYLDFAIYSVGAYLYLMTRKNMNIYFGVLALYFAFVTLVSGARFSIIFLLFATIFIFMATLRSRYSTRGAWGAVLVGGIIVAVVMIFLGDIFEYADNSEYLSFSSARLESMLEGGDASVEGRKRLIDQALIITGENVFFGHGIGSSERILGAEYAHNMFLETWMESGLLNMLLLMVLICYGYYISYKVIWYGDEYTFISLLYIYSSLAYMKSFSIADSRILIFSMAALVASYSYRRMGRRRRRRRRRCRVGNAGSDMPATHKP